MYVHKIDLPTKQYDRSRFDAVNRVKSSMIIPLVIKTGVTVLQNYMFKKNILTFSFVNVIRINKRENSCLGMNAV